MVIMFMTMRHRLEYPDFAALLTAFRDSCEGDGRGSIPGSDRDFSRSEWPTHRPIYPTWQTFPGVKRLELGSSQPLSRADVENILSFPQLLSASSLRSDIVQNLASRFKSGDISVLQVLPFISLSWIWLYFILFIFVIFRGFVLGYPQMVMIITINRSICSFGFHCFYIKSGGFNIHTENTLVGLSAAHSLQTRPVDVGCPSTQCEQPHWFTTANTAIS
jgi:hypothetical protein